MKFKIYLLTVLLLGLVACGGEQVVDVAKEVVAETVSQPEANQNTGMAEAEFVEADEETAVTDSESMSGNSMGGGSMASGTVSDAVAQAETTFNISDNNNEELSDEARQAIQILAAIPEVGEWLATFPDWEADAWQDDEDGRFYSVDLYSEAADEWLGWGYVNVSDGTVDDYFVPRELSAEEFQAGLERVEQFVFSDGELLGRLGDVANWEHDSWYNRWEGNWEIWFWYGLEEVAVTVSIWEDELYIDRIYNPAELEAEEAAENSKNMAIDLAWQADGIDQAVAGVDNWQTYVSQQSETVWAVTFATTDQELFYALVDIESEQILESE
jgi:hypothetical protein